MQPKVQLVRHAECCICQVFNDSKHGCHLAGTKKTCSPDTNDIIFDLDEYEKSGRTDVLLISGIVWDTEDNGETPQEDYGLPSAVLLPQIPLDSVADVLSDLYGFCVFTFHYEGNVKRNIK